jgi:hypothetical protein
VKPIFVLITTIFACYAQPSTHDMHSAVQISKQTSGSFELYAGSLELDVHISETAQLFHVVDQISQWSEFSHSQCVRYFESLGGGLTESDRKILAEHVAIRKSTVGATGRSRSSTRRWI